MRCRSRRNRTVFAAVVLFVMALSFASVNGWWYVSNFGVPWSNQFPEWHFGFTTMLLGLSVLALLLAAWFHFSRARGPALAAHPRGPNPALPVGDCRLGAGVLRGGVADPGDDRPVPGVVGGPLQPARRSTGKTCGLANDVHGRAGSQRRDARPGRRAGRRGAGPATSRGSPPTEFPPTSPPTR